MSSPGLTEAQVQTLSVDVEKQMPITTLERGLDYARSGSVSNLRVTDATITATVRGSESYYVVLDRQWFALGSGCSCPYESLCKHIAAVFFTLYADFGSPEQLLHTWKEEKRQPARVKPGNAAPAVQEMRRQEAMPKMAVGTAPFVDWEKYVEFKLSDVIDSRGPYDGDWTRRFEKIEVKIGELIAGSSSWSSEQHLVYKVLVQVVAIRRVLWGLKTVAGMERSWYFSMPPLLSVARELVSRLAEDLVGISGQEIGQVSPERAGELALYLQMWVTTESSNWKVPADTHQVVWLHVLRHLQNPLAEAEKWLRSDDSLQASLQATANKQDVKVSRNPLRAMTTLYLLGGTDDKPQAILAGSKEFDWDYALTIPPLLLQLTAMARALDWLRWLGERVPSDKPALTRPLIELWLRMGQMLPEVQDEALDFLRHHGNRDGFYYSQGLLQFGRSRSWVETQLLHGFFPSDLARDYLRQVEKDGPQNLLPLYHQAVERAVAQKNRGAYRIAVRWLKKLRTYYKKLKQTDDWDRFVAQFKAKHSRLRALQEELQRAGIGE